MNRKNTMSQWLPVIVILTLTIAIRPSAALGVCPTHIAPVTQELKVASYSLDQITTSARWTVSPTLAVDNGGCHITAFISQLKADGSGCQPMAHFTTQHPTPTQLENGCVYSFTNTDGSHSATLELTCDPTAAMMVLEPKADLTSGSLMIKGRYSGVCDVRSSGKVRSFSTAEAVSTMWPDCSAVTTKFSVGALGGEFLSIGCNFQAFVEINTNSLSVNATTTILVANGYVEGSQSNGIGIVGPIATRVSLVGTFHITVRGMVFGPNAIMTFTGAFPPGSSLVMDGNSFYLTQPTVAISIGASSAALSLTNGSYLSASNNIVGGNRTGGSALRAVSLVNREVYLSDSSHLRIDGNALQKATATSSLYTVQASIRNLTASKNSTISMSGNSIKDSSAGTLSSVYWTFSVFQNRPTVVLFEGSIIIDKNEIANCTGTAAYNVYWYNYVSLNESNIFLSDRSMLSISGNGISSSNFTVSLFVVYLYRYEDITTGSALIIAGGSSFVLNDNWANNLAYGYAWDSRYVVYWQWNSKCSLFVSDGSAITLNNNSATNVATRSDFCTSYWSWSAGISLDLTNGSRITCNGNTIRNSNAQTIRAGYWYWSTLPNTTCTNNSFISLDGNTVHDAIASYDVHVVSWDAYQGSSFLLFSQNSNISLSRNGVWNVSQVGSGEISAIHMEWSNYLFSIQFNISQGSSILINNNYISNVTTKSLYIIYWYYSGACQLAFDNLSQIAINNNTAIDFNITALPSVVLFYWYFSSGSSIRIGSGSRFVVEDNSAMYSNRFIYVRAPVTLETNGTVSIHRNVAFNTVSLTRFVELVGAFSMSQSFFLVMNNVILAPNRIANFVLVRLSSFTNATDSAIWACNNSLSWDSSSASTPAPYLTPLSFSRLAALCVPLTSTSAAVITTRLTTTPRLTTAAQPTILATTTRPTTLRVPTSTTNGVPPLTTSNTQSVAPTLCAFETRVVSQQGASLTQITLSVSERSGIVSRVLNNTNGTITATAVFCTEADRNSFVTAANSGQVPSVSYAAAMSPYVPDGKEENANLGMIVGIIVGAVVCIAIVGVVVFVVHRRKRNRQSNVFENEMNGQSLVTQENLLKVEAAEDIQL